MALVFVMLAPLAGICLFAAGLLIEMILLATHFCNALPGGVLWVATPGVLAIGTYYAGLFLLVSWPVAHPYYRSAGRLGIVLILIFLTAVFWPPSWRDHGTMEAVFLDVGQGDALLIKLSLIHI